MVESPMYFGESGWNYNGVTIPTGQVAGTKQNSGWNHTTVLWSQKGRMTVRVVMVISMDTTALLLVWALLELVCKRERRSEGVQFILKTCYVSSLIITITFLNVALYLHPLHPSCTAIVGLAYVSVLCTLSWALLTSVQRFLMALNVSPEQIRSQRIAIGVTVIYLVVGYGVPCSGLVTLMTYFSSRNFVAHSMCWLSPEAVWWMIIPVLIFVGGTYAVAGLAFRQYRNTSPQVRCFLYTSFMLSVMFSTSMLMIQVDVSWPSVSKGYVILILIIVHDILVWFHLTDTLNEYCPCAQASEDYMDAEVFPGSRQRDFHYVVTAQPLTQTPRQGQVPGGDLLSTSRQQSGQGLGQTPATQSPSKDELDKKSACDFVDDMGAGDEDIYFECVREAAENECVTEPVSAACTDEAGADVHCAKESVPSTCAEDVGSVKSSVSKRDHDINPP